MGVVGEEGGRRLNGGVGVCVVRTAGLTLGSRSFLESGRAGALRIALAGRSCLGRDTLPLIGFHRFRE
jgi:hypothetical protein